MNSFCSVCNALCPSTFEEQISMYAARDHTCCQMCGARGRRIEYDQFMLHQKKRKEMTVREAMLYCFDNPGKVVVNKNHQNRRYCYIDTTFRFWNCLDCEWDSKTDLGITDKSCQDKFIFEEDLEKPLSKDDQDLLDYIKSHTFVTAEAIEEYLRSRNK